MKRFVIFLATIELGRIGSSVAIAQEVNTDTISVTRIVICETILNREPIEDIHKRRPAWLSHPDTLFCFTELNGIVGKIVHVWYHGDSVRAKITLNKSKAGRWRTWSSKNMKPYRESEIDRWRVDVLDEEGKVLKRIDFKYSWQPPPAVSF